LRRSTTCQDRTVTFHEECAHLEIEEADSPPGSIAVGNSWGEFERAVLPSIAEDLSPGTLGVSQLSFYFGVLAALGIVQAVLEGAEGEGAIEIALDGLRDEVEGFIEASGETVN
jgi:hypothetical protein